MLSHVSVERQYKGLNISFCSNLQTPHHSVLGWGILSLGWASLCLKGPFRFEIHRDYLGVSNTYSDHVSGFVLLPVMWHLLFLVLHFLTELSKSLMRYLNDWRVLFFFCPHGDTFSLLECRLLMTEGMCCCGLWDSNRRYWSVWVSFL